MVIYILWAGVSVLAAATVGAVVAGAVGKMHDPPIKKRTAAGISSVVVFILVLAVIYGVAEYQKSQQSAPEKAERPPSSTDKLESSAPGEGASTAEAETPLTSTTAPMQTFTTAAPEPAAPDQVVVEVQLSEPTVGRKVGANKFELVDWAGAPTAHVRYRWEVRSEGVPVGGDDCEILVSVTGPQALAGNRSAECGQGYRSAFNSQGTQFAIHKAGKYTIKVEDKVSGATGTVDFEVVN